MKFLTPLYKSISSFFISKKHFKFRTITSVLFPEELESIHPIYSNPFFTLLGLCKTLSSLKKIHAILIIHGKSDDVLLKTKLISFYGRFGHVKIARVLFDEIPNPNFLACKAMIRWYFMNESYLEIIGFYNYARKHVKLIDNVVFSIVLKACSELHGLDQGRKLHGLIVKVGNPDSFVLTGIVDMYAKCGEMDTSRDVFEGIVDRNVVCWTSMIVGYVQNGCAEEGLILFNRMRDGLVEGNEYTFGSIVTACAKLGAIHQGKCVHGYAIKMGIEFNPYLVTALLDMYVKCGAIMDAHSIFCESSVIDLVSLTALIVGYAQNGYPYEALKLFMDNKLEGLLPNSVTTASVVSACAQLGVLKLGASIHGLVIKLRLVDATVVNALLHMYGKCGMIEDACYLFQTLSYKDVIAWNSIISGYCSNGLSYEALKLFYQMRSEYLQPDAFTVVMVLSACASCGALDVGSFLHGYSIKEGLLSSTFVGTALLNFYAKCGDAKSARTVFDGMVEKNTVTWRAMIGGYGIQGDSNNSLSLLDDMVNERLEPDDIIFTAVLSACSHAGMIEEGWRYFTKMSQEYKFVPTMKHYACIVDLLARAGRLEEALDFINKMPIQPDISLFGAFLHGCSIYSRFDLGELGVRKMLELHPHDACYYVLMSNLYASNGKWDQSHHVRYLMPEKGCRKFPGLSHVTIDSKSELYSQRVASTVPKLLTTP